MTATFPGYTTIPTIPTTQNQQTLVLSQLGVISSQPNILPNHSAAGNGQVAQQKQQDMHKVSQRLFVQSVLLVLIEHSLYKFVFRFWGEYNNRKNCEKNVIEFLVLRLFPAKRLCKKWQVVQAV